MATISAVILRSIKDLSSPPPPLGLDLAIRHEYLGTLLLEMLYSNAQTLDASADDARQDIIRPL
jgi:hypothetical protein